MIPRNVRTKLKQIYLHQMKVKSLVNDVIEAFPELDTVDDSKDESVGLTWSQNVDQQGGLYTPEQSEALLSEMISKMEKTK